ncbi:AI-2E family transporter [Trujillonella endophytica]|uniref:Predicted PurR-regulated permease PerM n=1 Tax=Trujillonella endophytica TaxID=673521 RepID=A0A1H8UHK8_9ACTN|nr:AI-2E family transporter [Trujillella endophytica]SEP02374.1 Predicted PurR-regulated permease PerM [Trujillella endophytica]
MLRRAGVLVGRARERIRAAAEADPHGWHARDEDRSILVRDDEPTPAPAVAPDATAAGSTAPPLGSPEPGAPDLDGATGPAGVSGPPAPGGAPHRRSPRRPVGDASVPTGLQTAAAWSWRLIVVLVGGYVLITAAASVAVVIVPVIIALMLAALLQPGAAALVRRGWPRSLGAIAMLLVGLGVVAGIITLVVERFIAGFEDLSEQVSAGLEQVRDYIVDTFPVTESQLDQALEQAQDFFAGNSEQIASGAIDTAATVGEVFTGFVLALFTLFFFLKDGRSIWLWLVGLLPTDARAFTDEAARRAWRTLISYTRATVIVALVDAVGIGIGLAILQVPLVIPLAALVFLGAFIPIIGSFLAGSVAVLVALVAVGPVKALIALAIVVLVMQVEGHILQPLLLGRAVHVHPLAVVLAIAAGLLIAGIFGALIAVPVVACANVAGTYLARRHDGPRPPEPRPERGKPAVGVRG